MGPGHEGNRRDDDTDEFQDYVEWAAPARPTPQVDTTSRRKGIAFGAMAVVAVIAVLTAVSIGILSKEDRQASPSPTSSPVTTTKPSPSPSISTRNTPPRPAGTSDPISGKWLDNYGNVVEFQPDGTNSWIGEVIQGTSNICLPAHYRIAGSGTKYKGTEAFYKRSVECGAYIGDGPFTLTLSPGGMSATVWSAPPGSGSCTNCGTFTWKKQ